MTTKIRRPGIVVRVTDEMQSGRSQQCPIADAIKAAMPNVRHVHVNLHTIQFTDDKVGKRYVYATPAVAQIVIVNYDTGRSSLGELTVPLGQPKEVFTVAA